MGGQTKIDGCEQADGAVRFAGATSAEFQTNVRRGCRSVYGTVTQRNTKTVMKAKHGPL